MPVATDGNFLAELERIFKDEFLAASPLYQAASKIKLPYEDIHGKTLMYRGSLKAIGRQVEQYADIRYYRRDPDPEEVIETASVFGKYAGIFIDSLIRAENIRSKVPDFTDARNVIVTDIFEHSDGRRNLQVFYSAPGALSVSDPAAIGHGYFGYRFYFASAAIVLEYKADKANATTSTGSQS